MSSFICDRCRLEVLTSNSCRRYDEYTHANFGPLAQPDIFEDRHLFSVGQCEGSPSRRLQMNEFAGMEVQEFDTSIEYDGWPFARPKNSGVGSDEVDVGTM